MRQIRKSTFETNSSSAHSLVILKEDLLSKALEDAQENLFYTDDEIAKDIFRLLRGSTNLVFCNSRFTTETLASKLEMLSQNSFVPNEFFPHHGSLSKDLRESLEYRLQEGRWPTTAHGNRYPSRQERVHVV